MEKKNTYTIDNLREDLCCAIRNYKNLGTNNIRWKVAEQDNLLTITAGIDTYEISVKKKEKHLAPVICLSTREGFPDSLKIGESYLVDKESIWIDTEGDTYGDVYAADGSRRVGTFLLNHFCSYRVI